jgi:hypothetical protein
MSNQKAIIGILAIISLVIVTSRVEASPHIDAHTTNILARRICNVFKSRRYTDREFVDYVYWEVERNLPQSRQVENNSSLLSSITSDVNSSVRQSDLSTETRRIFNYSMNKCK